MQRSICTALGLHAGDPHELIGLAFAQNFLMLGSYYLSQPLRDELLMTDSGVQRSLPLLFNISLLATVLCNRGFSILLKAYPVSLLLPLVCQHFTLHLVLFWFVIVVAGAVSLLGELFFIWMGCFNLLTFTLMWTALSGAMTPPQAARSFGAVAAGGTLGQIVGSFAARSFVTYFHPHNLLLVSCLMMLLASELGRKIRHIPKIVAVEQQTVVEPKNSLIMELVISPIDNSTSLWKEIQAVFSTQLLTFISVHIFFVYYFNAVLFFRKQVVFANMEMANTQRTQTRADFNIATGTVSVLVQLLGTGRFMSFFGVNIAIMLEPVLTCFGFWLLDDSMSVLTMSAFIIGRKVVSYAIDKPAREALFSANLASDRAVSKNFIDTFVARSGDAVGALTYTAFASHQELFFMFNGILSVLWVLCSFKLGNIFIHSV